MSLFQHQQDVWIRHHIATSGRGSNQQPSGYQPTRSTTIK
jgi:hypothetical protein